jgi:serine/threonine-protein kinase
MSSDLMLQVGKRVSAVSMVAAGLWSLSFVLNTLVASLLGHPAIIEELWPYPGLPVSTVGFGVAILLALVAKRFGARPRLLLNVSAGFLVLNCLLAAILTQWLPPPVTPRVSWLCIMILAFPAIVPMSPKRTLLVSLLAASMEPLALGVTELRGVSFDHDFFYLLWDFLPTYVCAFVAVVPAKLIGKLGEQVRQAKELGSYRLDELLGKGGMGEVYRASHHMLARPAAIKLIRSEILGSSSPEDARVIIERFRREAEAAASLRSPHTINLYDFGASQDGTFFLVMELLDGLDLQSLVERFGPLPPDRTGYLLRQVCESLAEAHARGLIHRDIKPSNIFSCRIGLKVDFVKVLDFGLVKARDTGERQETLLTAPDTTAGTPAYIAPEILRGDPVDHRVDIYAVGCVAYWLLTGHLVFEAPNALQLMFQHAQNAPVPPSERSELTIPSAMDELVLACLAKRPEDRPASAEELGNRLAATMTAEGWTEDLALCWWQRHHPESARPNVIACERTLTKRMNSDWSEQTEKSSMPDGVTAARPTSAH